ncbi:PepSY-associated TM helix domain-containing protein [Corynebacterium confusum]|uniref:PepSY-associated TM helix domain-containing protein n=1 Tax=uncultured Corynebacterium sp. TaxID=159447 RepID=UPI0025E06801|nr:PepSY domain-containing protein [uncultured Corynebacterium sp.]
MNFINTGLGALTKRLHFYAGLFIAPFILVAAISGAGYAVAPQIENFVYRDLLHVSANDAPPQPLSDQVRAAQAAYPDYPVEQVWPADSATDTSRVLVADPALGESRLLAVFVNPYDSHVLGAQPSYSGVGELPVRYWFSQLHKSLHLGDIGALYSELAASWMWFVALGGLAIWLCYRRPRTTWSGRRGLMRLHGSLGTWLLVVLLGLSATGITWSNVAGANVATTISALRGSADPVDTALPRPPVVAGKWFDAEIADQADGVWRTARDAGLTGPLRLFPGEDTAHGWQAAERWVPWRLASDAVAIDPTAQAVTASLPFSDLPLFSQLTSWGTYLHMGIMFGLPLQILLLASAVAIAVMIGAGYAMWFKRRPTRIPGRHPRLSWGEWAIVGLFVATAGTFLPLFGATLVLFIAVDQWKMKRRWRGNPAASALPSDQKEGSLVKP